MTDEPAGAAYKGRRVLKDVELQQTIERLHTKVRQSQEEIQTLLDSLGRVLINAGIGRVSALGANRTRRDDGNDVNDRMRHRVPLQPAGRTGNLASIP
jgi:hypothetical protein